MPAAPPVAVAPPPVEPIVTPSPVSPPALTPAPPVATPAAMVTATAPAAEPPVLRRLADLDLDRVGAAVVVGGAVALVLATRSDKFPDAPSGPVAGN